MSTKPQRKRLPPVTPDEAKRLIDIVDRAVDEFVGDLDHLEAAIGMYLMGRHFGWKVLVLIHNKRTIRRCEEILGIDIRRDLPETTPHSTRSHAYKAVLGVSNFWKAVSGEIKIPDKKLASDK